MLLEEKQSPMILAIESSCDDTAVAVLKGAKVLSNIVASQLEHSDFGGVVPELASRAHMQNMVPVYLKALEMAQVNADKIDVIAYTNGPGLMGSLLVGTSFAKSLALALDVPLIQVNHIEAHVLAHLIQNDKQSNPTFPYVCLTVSGGHTQLFYVKSPSSIIPIGGTIDDAAGEAFDKIAKMLGLSYPGGPLLDRLAQNGDPNKFKFVAPIYKHVDFTFSGLKTAVLYFLQKSIKDDVAFIEKNLNDICASVQKTIVDALMKQSLNALNKFSCKQFAIAGGVSANSALRFAVKDLDKKGFDVYIPDFQFCTDNAAMIGVVGYYKYLDKMFSSISVTPQTK